AEVDSSGPSDRQPGHCAVVHDGDHAQSASRGLAGHADLHGGVQAGSLGILRQESGAGSAGGRAVSVAIYIVQLGSLRKAGEGLRVGTVRRPPRGVRKSDFAKRDYYDVWFPNLSPSAELVAEALAARDDRAWRA